MKQCLTVFLSFFCNGLLAQSISVDIQEFLIRKGDYVTIEVKADRALDESKNTTICLSDKRECYLSGAKIEIKAEVNKKGLTTVGPYQLQFGKDGVQVPTQKIIALPALKNGEIDISGAVDPNGSGRFMLRIDWKGKGVVAYANPIRLREGLWVYPSCNNPKGLVLRGSSGSHNHEEGEFTAFFDNTSDKPITLTNKDFTNLPEDYKAISIDVPPSKKVREDCKHRRSM